MNTKQALQLVFNLAEGGALDHDDLGNDGILEADFQKQQLALEIVDNFIREFKETYVVTVRHDGGETDNIEFKADSIEGLIESVLKSYGEHAKNVSSIFVTKKD